MAAPGSFSGGAAICNALPVLWMTYDCTQWPETCDAESENDSPGGSTDLTPWCALKLVHQGAAPDRGGVFFRTREEKID